MNTRNLDLPTWDEGNTEPNLVFNDLLLAVDALIQLTPEAITATPPSSPSDGQSWIVAASATGAWVGKDQQVAVALNGSWLFYPPTKGWEAQIKALGARYVFDGTTWAADSSGGGGSGVSSVNGLTGAVNFAAGTGTTVTTSGSTITIGVSGGGGAGVPYFFFEDYGAIGDGTTDDTAAIQATLNACGTAGGGVCAPRNGDRTYLISGAMQDTSTSNAQLLVPKRDYADDPCISVVITGYTPPATTFSVTGTGALPAGGTRFKSTSTASTGSVIGGVGPTGTANSFTNILFKLINVVIETPANPTITGLDARKFANLQTKNVLVDAGQFVASSMVLPTTATSFGIRCPGNGNGAFTSMEDTMVVGFYNGIEVNEHATGNNLSAWACYNGLQFVGCDHASNFQRVMCVHVRRPVSGPTSLAHRTMIAQLDLEHASSGAFATDKDVYDASNLLYGTIRWHIVLAGVGFSSAFTQTGGQHLQTWQTGNETPYRTFSTTSDTPSLADNQGFCEASSSSAITVTIPAESSVPWKDDTLLTYRAGAAGQITISPASGVTITPATPKTRAQYSVIALRRTGTNTWSAFGDTA